ncbi:hypothetical protein COV23_00570 [Candidatus Wolfebacteria bacterium CG10_big_fil_rev_8_21_14_0_10_31_9]|uniref:Uncharacterized protein n=1 Tax=Candidatus Wolfebacteria bacterium CG10_big_fil_rev_8_21_14_0_10_31_9 TaxID=1975070 RepID=A0A2H0REV2_9BACT|nr:MAG: hypothetical protein COV23_00570 [Candidatus Wolfebacteria bacterium CG10_big_fil_rev_8_21_14_0_10_31_9]
MDNDLKNKAIKLRKSGKTFSEINKILKVDISKSTMSYWFKGIIFSKKQKERIEKIVMNNVKKGQIAALKVNRLRILEYLDSIDKRAQHLSSLMNNKDVAKVSLAMLYLGEGSKKQKG